MRVIEICAGAGGQALGLERAGFEHQLLVELDPHAWDTLVVNRRQWGACFADVKKLHLTGAAAQNVDLLAGGVPCPPFSVAGKQLGKDDERDLFPHVIRLVSECHPRAVMIENVKGLMQPRFAAYRNSIKDALHELGYSVTWQLVNAADFGVPQFRQRSVLVAFRSSTAMLRFAWPQPKEQHVSVGSAIYDLMGAGGWGGVDLWKAKADKPAPTLVGGSKKHGGADLGPTRARAAWARLGVNGASLADAAPGPDFPFHGSPKLTLRMAARIQGFPDDWVFCGQKTAQYRQIGNAFPPPVAQMIGENIKTALASSVDSTSA